MSEPEATRERPGTPADRSALKSIGGMSTTSGAIGMLVASADYLLKCRDAHAWVTPDNALLVMWATALAPIFLLLNIIIQKRLKKIADE